MKNKDLALRDTLLWLAIGVGGWAFVVLQTCWWLGLIGVAVSALLIVIRYQMKIDDSKGSIPEPVTAK